MKCAIISLVLMSVCYAQGQSYAYASTGTGQQTIRYHRYGGSRNSAQAIADPYSINFSSARTSSDGYNANGTYYYRDTVENIIEDTLYHSERFEWPTLDIANQFRFKLDLSNPLAAPVWEYPQPPRAPRTNY